MVMALCQSSYNQGVYGLVTNLGSLVVRTIFFPVEEAAFRAFSRPSGRFPRSTNTGEGWGGGDVCQLRVLTFQHARMQWKGLYTALLVLPSHNYMTELVKISADSMKLRHL